MIVVDAGNLLLPRAGKATSDAGLEPALKKAQTIAEAYQAMAYDAVAVSGNDLLAGVDFFRQARATGLPFVAANVSDKEGKLPFSAHRIKHIGPLTLGIIGLTGGTVDKNSDFIVEDWRPALREQITLLQKECTMLLVLSSLSDDENLQLQKDFQQVDLLVTADKEGRNILPQAVHNSLRLQSGSQGKYLGSLEITRFGPNEWSPAAAGSIAQSEADKQTGKTYRSFFLVVHPVN